MDTNLRLMEESEQTMDQDVTEQKEQSKERGEITPTAGFAGQHRGRLGQIMGVGKNEG